MKQEGGALRHGAINSSSSDRRHNSNYRCRNRCQTSPLDLCLRRRRKNRSLLLCKRDSHYRDSRQRAVEAPVVVCVSRLKARRRPPAIHTTRKAGAPHSRNSLHNSPIHLARTTPHYLGVRPLLLINLLAVPAGRRSHLFLRLQHRVLSPPPRPSMTS